MNKTFEKFLQRVTIQFECRDAWNERSRDRSQDRRLYLFARLASISTFMKAGYESTAVTAILDRGYLEDLANGDAWWRG